MPIGIYRLTLRAVKYGALFVVMTFVSYFLFETVAGLRLHPLQYLMVGLANTVFFLLLISLAEHIGFGLSYLASTIASSALVVGYSHAILGNRSRAGIVGGVLLFLYGFLYMTLQAETYALARRRDRPLGDVGNHHVPHAPHRLVRDVGDDAPAQP